MNDPDVAGSESGDALAVRPQTRNTLPGTVFGSVVQAGTVHGNVVQHFHEASLDIAPNTLPARAAHFVDRIPLMAELDRAWALCGDDRVPLLALIGPGGVGKTAVAVEWLHRRRSELFYGSLHADLGGPSVSAAVSPMEVLAQFLRALGIHPRLIPDSLDERSALLRSVTAARPVLMLLDNAVSAAQVFPLLPTSAGNIVVMTSRHRLPRLAAVAGARMTDVGPLDSAASLELLGKAVPDERISTDRDSARALARHCAGFPLALSITAARLVNHPRWSVAHAANRLANARDVQAGSAIGEDMSVRTVIEDSYNALASDAQNMYRALGLHPGPSFDTAAAAAAAGIPIAHATVLLEALHDASLLVEVGPDRFGFHDLIRVDARRRAEETDSLEQRDAALRRMLGGYLRGVVQADAAVAPGRWHLNDDYDEVRRAGSTMNEDSAWAWLEMERVNLLACVRTADSMGLDELTWRFCEALWGLYFRRHYYDDWTESHELGVPAAVRLGDGRAEGRMRCQLGIAYVERQRFDDARHQFAAALVADRAAGHRRGQATAWEQLGSLEESVGHLDTAVEAFTTALALADDSRAVAINWHRLGRVHLAAGRMREATDAFERSRELFAALDPPDSYNVARVTTSLGEQEIRLGHGREALDLLGAALPVMIHERARRQEADIRWLLATAYMLVGDVAAAREEAGAAVALYRALGRPEAETVQAFLDEISAA